MYPLQYLKRGDVVCHIYSRIVCVLLEAEARFVPQRSKGFFKFWWDEELDVLKQASIDTNNAWKLAGKPRSGPIFDKRQKARALYRKSIRDHEALSVGSYTNDLHEALLKKTELLFGSVGVQTLSQLTGVQRLIILLTSLL